MIKLNQWKYDRGYMTTLMAVCIDEISGISEINDPYRNHSGSIVSMKNGATYEVKENVYEILSMLEKVKQRGKQE